MGKLQLFKWIFIGNDKKSLCLVKMSKHDMQYYFIFKIWPLAVIKLMESLCLNPFQEAWWEDKEKEEGSKSNHAMDKEKKPCMAQR